MILKVFPRYWFELKVFRESVVRCKVTCWMLHKLKSDVKRKTYFGTNGEILKCINLKRDSVMD